MEQRQPRLIAIHEKFEKTPYGQALAGRVRYDRYKPNTVTNERWVDLLGADVNNLTHLTLTYGLTQDFVRVARQLQSEYLSGEEEELLQVAALIHDWAESIVGDITFGDKTDDDELNEQAAFEAHVAEFYTGDATELIHKARTEVVFDHAGDNKLGKIFNAVERVGYLRTALRAHDHILRGDAPDCQDGLSWLVVDVLGQQPIPLMQHAQTLLPVGQYLQNQSERITEAFELVDEAAFLNYPPEQQAAKKSQFEQSYAAWRERSVQK